MRPEYHAHRLHSRTGYTRKIRIAIKTSERKVFNKRVYDLENDPAELAGKPMMEEDELVRRLLSKVASDPDPSGIPVQYEAGKKLDRPKIDPRVGADDLEALRALGYAE